jgi:hypothetical protein
VGQAFELPIDDGGFGGQGEVAATWGTKASG